MEEQPLVLTSLEKVFLIAVLEDVVHDFHATEDRTTRVFAADMLRDKFGVVVSL
jgi:hypothetical protein